MIDDIIAVCYNAFIDNLGLTILQSVFFIFDFHTIIKIAISYQIYAGHIPRKVIFTPENLFVDFIGVFLSLLDMQFVLIFIILNALIYGHIGDGKYLVLIRKLRVCEFH